MVLKIAHRGFSSISPENSIESFKKAASLGIDMVEFDVHQTKDGHIVVMHDENLYRTIKRKGRIKDLKLEEIRKFHLMNGEPVPTLKEVIKVVKDKCGLNTDIKSQEITNKILAIIKEEKIENKVILSSFYSNVIKLIKKKEPGIKTCFLVADKKIKIIILYLFRPVLPYLFVSIAKKIKTDSMGLHYKLVTDKIIQSLHKNNIKIGVWTVNTKKDFKKMQLLGVDAIISDYPDILNV